MNRRRDWLWSILIATGLMFALLAVTDLGSVLRIRQLMEAFRGGEEEMWVPFWPYVFKTLQILFLYVLLGVVLGSVLFVFARGFASRRDDRGEWQVPRRRYYLVFLILLLTVTFYMHFHALLLYPGLFVSAHRWAFLAGSPEIVAAVGLAGIIGTIALALLLVQKRRDTVRLWIRRYGLVVLAVLVVMTGAWAVNKWVSQPKRRNIGPNLILIGLDSIRPDHVSSLGYREATGRTTTPNLDAFLKEAVLFRETFVPLARTGPSWIATLTACYPTKNDNRCDMAPKESRIPPVPSLAEHLREMGYATSFFIDNTNFMHMDPEMGFDHIDQPDPNVVWFALSHFPIHLMMYYYCLNNPAGFYYSPMLRANQAFSAVYDPKHYADRIDRHLARMTGEDKFFLAAHTCIVHAPFTVRYPWSTYFSPPPPVPKNRFVFRWPIDEMLSKKELSLRRDPEQMGPLFSQEINLYDALARETDEWLGEVLDSIRKHDLYDNSMIVVWSDHGEDLFRQDHAYHYFASNHGWHVWGDGSFKVVLAIKFPNSENAGVTVPWLTRSIDIGPTALDALGLAPLPGTQGLSLMPQVENPSLDPELDVYEEPGLSLESWFLPEHRPYPFPHFLAFQYVDRDNLRIYRKEEYMRGFVMAKDRALRDSRWKICAYPMKGEPVSFKTTLHDVVADPTNRIDLSRSRPQVLAEMRGRLAPYIETDAAKHRFEWHWNDEPITTETSIIKIVTLDSE